MISLNQKWKLNSQTDVEYNQNHLRFCSSFFPFLHSLLSKESISISISKKMGVFSNKIDHEQLNPGDHIYSWRQAYIYAHHGICLFFIF